MDQEDGGTVTRRGVLARVAQQLVERQDGCIFHQPAAAVRWAPPKLCGAPGARFEFQPAHPGLVGGVHVCDPPRQPLTWPDINTPRPGCGLGRRAGWVRHSPGSGSQMRGPSMSPYVATALSLKLWSLLLFQRRAAHRRSLGTWLP